MPENSSKKPSSRSKVKPKTRASQYPRATRWMVENDYRDKLSREDKLFLDRFNEMYGGDNPQLIYNKKADRRRVWRETRRIRLDAMVGSTEYMERDGLGANQEDVVIALLDQEVCPSGENLRQRVKVRRETREFDEATKAAQAAALRPKRRPRRKSRNN